MTSPWIIAFSLLTLLVMALALTVVGLLRRTADLLERAEGALQAAPPPVAGGPLSGVAVGGYVRPFVVTDRDGRDVPSAEVLQPGPVAVVLMEPGCGACENLAEQLQEEGWNSLTDGQLLVVLPSTDESRHFVPAEIPIGFQDNGNVALALDSNVSPHVLVLDSDGLVLANDVPLDLAAIRGLLAAANQAKVGDALHGVYGVGADSETSGFAAGLHIHDLVKSPR